MGASPHHKRHCGEAHLFPYPLSLALRRRRDNKRIETRGSEKEDYACRTHNGGAQVVKPFPSSPSSPSFPPLLLRRLARFRVSLRSRAAARRDTSARIQINLRLAEFPQLSVFLSRRKRQGRRGAALCRGIRTADRIEWPSAHIGIETVFEETLLARNITR